MAYDDKQMTKSPFGVGGLKTLKHVQEEQTSKSKDGASIYDLHNRFLGTTNVLMMGQSFVKKKKSLDIHRVYLQIMGQLSMW